MVLYLGALEFALQRSKYPGQTMNQMLIRQLDDEELSEEARSQLSQIFFFLGITYRQLHQYEEAVQSYQNAI